MVASTLIHHHGDPHLGAWLGSLRFLFGQLEAHQPWLSYDAIGYMEERLRPDSVVFEYGSGGSTLWFAERVRRVTSIEHDPDWHARVVQEARRAGITNCTIVLREPTRWASSEAEIADKRGEYSSPSAPGSFEDYVRACEGFADETFDLVLVDGKTRSACLRQVASKVRLGGLLALDDSERPLFRDDVLSLAAWPSTTFEGLRPGSPSQSRTTFWKRTARSP
jgi:hypothetical protein